jgi:hypothetical protein
MDIFNIGKGDEKSGTSILSYSDDEVEISLGSWTSIRLCGIHFTCSSEEGEVFHPFVVGDRDPRKSPIRDKNIKGIALTMILRFFSNNHEKFAEYAEHLFQQGIIKGKEEKEKEIKQCFKKCLGISLD